MMRAYTGVGNSMKWLLMVDLDKTLWDCPDISALKPPFRGKDRYVIEDSQSTEVKVYQDLVKALEWAKHNGAIIAVLSWNDESKASEALRVAGLIDLVDFYIIRNYPRKDLMALELAEVLREKGHGDALRCSIYIDDMEVFLEQISKIMPGTCTLSAWRDFVDFNTLIFRIKDCLRRCSTLHETSCPGEHH